MRSLIIRNLKLFFRDKASVFFSLLAIFISIALYVLFLADTISGEDFNQLPDGRMILNLWLLSGLLSMSSVTTTLGGFQTMMMDRTSGKKKDFFVSSMPRYQLAASYILSAIIIGFIMTCITLSAGIGFFYFSDGVTLSFYQIVCAIGISLCNVIASATMFFPVVCFLKTSNSFGTFSSLVNTLIGFLLGVYVPIGALPDIAQTLIRIFPISHGCTLLRALFTKILLADAIPDAAIVAEVEDSLGITLSFQGTPLSPAVHFFVLALTIIIFSALSLWSYHRKQR